MKGTEQQALADALTQLFGDGLEVELLRHGFGFNWQGESYGGLAWGWPNRDQEMELRHIVSAGLQTAHVTVLEGMGYAGEHPGALATSTCDFLDDPDGLRLRLLAEDGTELRSVFCPLSLY